MSLTHHDLCLVLQSSTKLGLVVDCRQVRNHLKLPMKLAHRQSLCLSTPHRQSFQLTRPNIQASDLIKLNSLSLLSLARDILSHLVVKQPHRQLQLKLPLSSVNLPGATVHIASVLSSLGQLSLHLLDSALGVLEILYS